jgi:hypothetical protein
MAAISLLLGSLFYSQMILAQPPETWPLPYDPWIDVNEDGVIDIFDVGVLSSHWGTSGTPVNKTELLLELAARTDSLNASLLADYYNITDCDSLFALLAHLHSGSDINGGILFVDEIIVGSTEGNNVIFFWDSGIPTGEYLYWQDSADRFFVSDDTYIAGSMNISGTINIPLTTRYYSTPASAWQPSNSTIAFSNSGTSVWTPNSGVTYWYAPVILPHRAVVTELKAWVYDNDGADIEVQLLRQVASGSSADSMAYVVSAGQMEIYWPLSTSLISYPTIDNHNNAYFLYGTLRSGDNNHRLSHVQIAYTIDEPLP